MSDRHEKKGIPITAKLHVQAIVENNSKTAVDVGSGPGSILIELMRQGVEEVYGIDLSPQMNELAKTRFEKEGIPQERYKLVTGSFLDEKASDEADAVSLHRVLCCHPDKESMVMKTIEYRPKLIINTMPRDWKLLRMLVGMVGWIADRMGSFRPYVHPIKTIDKLMEEQGYRIKSRKKGMIWVTTIYERLRDD